MTNYVEPVVKRIYILIGPKGSGKTYIGTPLQDQLHIPFLRVEDIALHCV